MAHATIAQRQAAELIARDTAGKDYVHDPDGAGLSMRRLIDYLTDAFGDADLARLTWGDAATAYVDEWERLAGWRGDGAGDGDGDGGDDGDELEPDLDTN